MYVVYVQSLNQVCIKKHFAERESNLSINPVVYKNMCTLELLKNQFRQAHTLERLTEQPIEETNKQEHNSCRFKVFKQWLNYDLKHKYSLKKVELEITDNKK